MTRTLLTAISLTLLSQTVFAETVLMVCDAKKTKAAYAQDGKVYWKLETGIIKSEIYFRDKLKWQSWCDIEWLKSKSSKTSEFVTGTYDQGDAAGACTRVWKRQSNENPNNPVFYTTYSYVDFVRQIYETTTDRKTNEKSKRILRHQSDCKLIQNLTDDK
jgi:hypothetical protein